MRAVHLTAFGNPVECLEFVQIEEPPAPGPGQVLIGVEFSPINLNDLLVAAAPTRFARACRASLATRAWAESWPSVQAWRMSRSAIAS